MNVILEQLKTHTQNKPNDIALHMMMKQLHIVN